MRRVSVIDWDKKSIVFFAVGRNGRGFVRLFETEWQELHESNPRLLHGSKNSWLPFHHVQIPFSASYLVLDLEKAGYHNAERLSAKSFIKHGAGSQCRFVLLHFLTLTVVRGN